MTQHPAFIGIAVATSIIIVGIMQDPSVSGALGREGIYGVVRDLGSFIGGILTIVAALIAWGSIRPQIVETRRQSAASAVLAIIPRARALDQETKNIIDIINIISDFRSSIIIYQAYHEGNEFEIFNNTKVKLKNLIEEERKYNNRYPGDEYGRRERVRFISVIYKISHRIRIIADIISNNNVDIDLDGNYIYNVDVEIENLEVLLKDVDEIGREFLMKLREMSRDLWLRIRELEDFSLGK